MIRSVGNNGGTPLDPATRHAGQDSFVSKVAKAETLGALKVRAGSGDGMPGTKAPGGESFRQFSAQLGLGPDILDGTGAGEKAETLGRLRAEARLSKNNDHEP